MSMIPSRRYGASNFNQSCFSQEFNFMDPFSVTMCWQKTAFVFSANIQCLGSEEVKIEIVDRRVCLTIQGGHCFKSCILPNNVNLDQTTACINNGILTVNVPKETDQKECKQCPPVVSASRSRFFC